MACRGVTPPAACPAGFHGAARAAADAAARARERCVSAARESCLLSIGALGSTIEKSDGGSIVVKRLRYSGNSSYLPGEGERWPRGTRGPAAPAGHAPATDAHARCDVRALSRLAQLG